MTSTKRSRRASIWVATFVVTTVLAAFSAELFARLLGGKPATFQFVYGKTFRDRQTDWDITYAITEGALRVSCGPDVGGRPSRKFAVLGDSFAFGEGIPDCEDFVSRLGFLNPGTRFINFGIPGVGIDVYKATARDRLDRSFTDVLVLFYGNDVTELSHKTAWGRLADTSSFFALVRRSWWKYSAPGPLVDNLIRETPLNNIQYILDQDSNYFHDVASASEDKRSVFRKEFAQLIQRLAHVVPRDRIWIAVAPEATTVSQTVRWFVGGLGGELPPFGVPGSNYEEIRALSRSHQVKFIDLFPWFLENGSEHYFPHDLHWSLKGHQLAAGVISRSLRIDDPSSRPSSKN